MEVIQGKNTLRKRQQLEEVNDNIENIKLYLFYFLPSQTDVKLA